MSFGTLVHGDSCLGETCQGDTRTARQLSGGIVVPPRLKQPFDRNRLLGYGVRIPKRKVCVAKVVQSTHC